MWPANAADAPAALGVLVAVAVVLALVLVGQSSVVTLIATAALGAVLIGLLVLLARVLRPAAQSRWCRSPARAASSGPVRSAAGSDDRLQDRLELLELAAHPAAHLVAELEHARVRDRVAGVVAVLRAADHAGGVQDAEVL